MVENYQSHWLAKSSIDPSVAAEEISAEERKRFLLQEKMHAPDHFRDMDELLKAAEKRLETFEAVGFAENLEESLHRISSRLGLAEPGKPVHANANPDPVRAEDLDTETTRVIQNLTQVDSELYKRALGSLH